MASTLAALPKGYEFPPTTFTLSPEWVKAYIEAVGDKAIDELGVPPMAIAAQAIRKLIESFPLPVGTLHAGQELEFRDAVDIGDELGVSARVVSRGERAGWVLMSIDLLVTGRSVHREKTVMTGRATVTFPVEA